MPAAETSSCQSPSWIFFILIVMVQAFMAFNGGATSATIDSIEKEDPTWDPAGIGVLGAMDKLGMTLASPVCGYLFQAFPAKMLLVTGLGVNAFACLLFGSLRLHYSMFAAKLLIGLTEGLQWVWSPQWISCWGSVGQPDETRKQTWMNVSSSIVAGVGAGLGMLIAGFGTVYGLGYEFAFKIEAGVLFIIWFYYCTLTEKQLGVDAIKDLPDEANTSFDGVWTKGVIKGLELQWKKSGRLNEIDVIDDRTIGLTLRSGRYIAELVNDDKLYWSDGDIWTREVEDPHSIQSSSKLLPGSQSPDKMGRRSSFAMMRVSTVKKTVSDQMRELWNNPLFCRCAVAFATVNFVTAGMQFLWVRLFTGLWEVVTKSHAVLSQLIVVAAGGGTGVALASTAIFNDSPKGPERPRFTTKAFGLAGVGALLAGSGALLQLHDALNDILTLGMVYTGVFVTCMGLNMTPGILQIICLDSVDDPQTRAFGTGVYQGLNNFLGLAMGPFIPQMVMSFAMHRGGAKLENGREPPGVLVCGFLCALGGVVVSLTCSSAALAAANSTATEADLARREGREAPAE